MAGHEAEDAQPVASLAGFFRNEHKEPSSPLGATGESLVAQATVVVRPK